MENFLFFSFKPLPSCHIHNRFWNSPGFRMDLLWAVRDIHVWQKFHGMGPCAYRTSWAVSDREIRFCKVTESHTNSHCWLKGNGGIHIKMKLLFSRHRHAYNRPKFQVGNLVLLIENQFQERGVMDAWLPADGRMWYISYIYCKKKPSSSCEVRFIDLITRPHCISNMCLALSLPTFSNYLKHSYIMPTLRIPYPQMMWIL